MGIIETAKGALKEKLGDVTDDPNLEQEGSAQKTKGEEEVREDKARLEAKAHEEQAEALDAEQRSVERS